MKRISYFVIVLIAGLAMSCGTTSKNEEAIIGRWFSQGWEREGQETDMTAWFEFNEDKTYRAVIQRQQEQGTWWIDGYKLFTQAEGQEKIMVKIERLEGSALELGMNRGGQSERIFLSKAN